VLGKEVNRVKKTSLMWCALACLAILYAGCAGQKLAMVDAGVKPLEVAPGDSALISVQVIDPENVVDSVTVTVDEYPEITLDLYDDGTEGDVTANDGVYSIEFEVPFEAPPGEFHWTFNAYDADGEELKIETEAGPVPLTAKGTITVTY
jgi:hypothetical protein